MIKNKFEEYFERTGVMKKWFATQIGVTQSNLNAWINGDRPIPQAYWMKIVKQSGGAITLCDLMENFIKDSTEINVKPGKTPDTCIVSLK